MEQTIPDFPAPAPLKPVDVPFDPSNIDAVVGAQVSVAPPLPSESAVPGWSAIEPPPVLVGTPVPTQYPAPLTPMAPPAPIFPGESPVAAVVPAFIAPPATIVEPPPFVAPVPAVVSTTAPAYVHEVGSDFTAPLKHSIPDADPSRPEIERLLYGLVVNGGSDMHLSGGEVPRFRVAGHLMPVAGEPELSTEDIERMMKGAVSERAWQEFVDTNDMDTSYEMSTAKGAALDSRFRVNVHRGLNQTGTVIRVIPTKIVSLDALGIPSSVKELAKRPRGIILFTGPTGSGKSTSMAGLVDLINETRAERIFTLEDPVEFTHKSKKCLVTHREIGEDTASFEEGLRRVRREDPDIILIGEMRDYETIAAAIEAADTGHLVIATLHTNSAPETISRLINSFPANQQEQIRVTLSSVLLAVVCQTLVPSPKSERGRVLACEVMFVNAAIRNNIRENDIPAIVGALMDRSYGNQSLDAHLAELVRDGWVTKKEAEKKASSIANLEAMLGGK